MGHIQKLMCCGYKLISFCISFVFSAEDDCVKLEIDRYNIDRICIKDLPIDLGQPAVSIEGYSRKKMYGWVGRHIILIIHG